MEEQTAVEEQVTEEPPASPGGGEPADGGAEPDLKSERVQEG